MTLRRAMYVSERRSRRSVWVASLGAVALIAICGCKHESNGTAIEGSVSYRGQALPGGSLTFFPATGRPVTAGVSDAGGYATEIPPGEYRVTVNVGLDLPEGWKESDPIPEQKIKLPRVYTNRAKTPLTATVAPDQSTPINFELK